MKPCKIWTRAKSKAGYGQVRRNGKTTYVHRNTWEDAYGPLLKGIHVLHRCDNRACYELTHLFLGDQRTNIKDAFAKKRHAHNMTHGRRKLTDVQVAAIRADPRSQRQIAPDYGIDRSLISYIKRGKIWK